MLPLAREQVASGSSRVHVSDGMAPSWLQRGVCFTPSRLRPRADCCYICAVNVSVPVTCRHCGRFVTRSQRTTKWRPYVSQISADRRLYETLTSLRQLIFNALPHSHPRQHSQYSYLTQASDFHLPYSQSLLTVLLSLLHHSLHQGRDRLVMVCQDGNDLGSRCKDLPAIAPY